MDTKVYPVLLATLLMALSTVGEANDPFELKEVLSEDLTAKGFGGTWVSDTQFIYTATDGSIQLYDMKEMKSGILLDKDNVLALKVKNYKRSADGNYLLLACDVQAVYRHSTLAKYLILEVSSKNTRELDTSYMQLAVWASKGNGVVYVKDNDIYYRSSATTESVRLTDDGEAGVVYNGVPDWVYEEEVLGSDTALWISPEGDMLAYAIFNDSDVKEVSYMHYGSPDSKDSQYSEIRTLRYPKPGTPNPYVTLRVVNLTKIEDNQELPLNRQEGEILSGVMWQGENVIVTWANREQNDVDILKFTLGDKITSTKIFSIEESSAWVEVSTPIFNANDEKFLMILPQQQNEKGDFNHITLVTPQTNAATPKINVLTNGLSVVTSIYGWNTKNGKIYYQATVESEPTQLQVFSVLEKESSTPECLSCNVVSGEGRLCKYASASFSTDLSYYALTCSGPDPAFVDLYSVDSTTGSLLRWDNNDGLRNSLKTKQMYDILYEQMAVQEFNTLGIQAQVHLWLPPGLDTSGNTKYPMIVDVYAGPNSVQVTDAFTLGWGAYLTTSRRYIYAMIDGTGSGRKGNEMLFKVSRRLGSLEIDDQISVTKALQEKHSFIDADRTGIWGWSYGGYATAMALARDKEGVFKCGASVAPVTNWRFYDSIYTERYMKQPDNNIWGYADGDLTRSTLLENLRNKSFFLLHGTADDNVHYQQSMMLSQVLEQKDILFSQQSYPDENHGLGSVQTHVYHSMDHFWSECFRADPSGGGASAVRAVGALTLLASLVLARLWTAPV